jgi:hypothetical protein
MRISCSIMSHKSRVFEARELLAKLEKMPFVSVALVTDDGQGEWATGVRALQHPHRMSDFLVVLQDDSIIGEHFFENLTQALEALPQESLLSLYLGRVRPNKKIVLDTFMRARFLGKSFISAKTCLWGVALCLPTADIEPMLAHANFHPNKLYDRRIGEYYNANRKPVYYTTKSLVNHDYTIPSLLGHDKSGEPRVAHYFVGDNLIEFNSEVEEIK